jgi:hypothetical protein
MKPTWVELSAKSPRSMHTNRSVRSPKFPTATLLLALALLSSAFTAAVADPAGSPPPESKQPPATQPPSVVTVNPPNAVRGAVVFVTLTAPPKNPKKVEIALDATLIPVDNPDPNGNYRVVIPDTVPLGKHRVAVIVDGSWFTGNESLDVERPGPAPKLTSISPTYLVGGSSDGTLTLIGENFASDLPADNHVLFDNADQHVVWDGCDQPSNWNSNDKATAHGKVDSLSTITLCNLQLPDRNSVEVNIRLGENNTASGLHLTISHYNRSPIILWSFGILFICIALVLFLAFFAHKYSIGDTKYGVWSILFVDLETNTYSLSKLQFYLWTAAAVLTYSYLVIGRLFVQRLDFPDVPSSLPGVIAIGAGTAIGSQFVTNVHGPKGGGPEKPSLGDFVTSGGVAAPDRVQMLVWTFVGVVGFCVAAFRLDPWTIKTLPQIGDSLMLLMGISSAGYLGGKLARKPGPVINAISLSPSRPDSSLANDANAPAAAANLSQPIAAAQQVYSNANNATIQPAQNLSANALAAAQAALVALKTALDAAKAAKADLLNTLTDNAAKADAASRVLAAEFSELVSQGADPTKVEATRQSAELAQELAAAAQDLATGVSQAIGSAQAQTAPSTSSISLRTIEIRGRNLSFDATFEISGADLPFRMLVGGAPEIVSPEDDASATNMARALRLKIDPNALGPTDRKTYDSWFQTGGKDLKFTISNPDGQISEITFTLPPGEQQALT